MDVIVGEYDGEIYYFENIGDRKNPSFSLSTDDTLFNSMDVGTRSTPVVVDLDGDNRFEAIIGNADGCLSYFESELFVSTKNVPRKNETLAIFPIPTRDLLNYNTTQLEGIKALHLFDLMGRLVKTDRDLNGVLDVSDLPSGQYTLIFEGEGKRVHRLIQKL